MYKILDLYPPATLPLLPHLLRKSGGLPRCEKREGLIFTEEIQRMLAGHCAATQGKHAHFIAVSGPTEASLPLIRRSRRWGSKASASILAVPLGASAF